MVLFFVNGIPNYTHEQQPLRGSAQADGDAGGRRRRDVEHEQEHE